VDSQQTFELAAAVSSPI